MWSAVEAAIATATGTPFKLERRTPVGGGCINSCYRIEGGGTPYFVKTNTPHKAHMFAAEAAGLEEIAKTGAIRVPQPICHGENRAASWLVLEHIVLGRSGDFQLLGRQLAVMHRATGRRFGWSRHNTIGATPQINTSTADWIGFWREHRLGFQLRLAAAKGYRGALQREGVKLLAKLPAFFAGHHPRPSLLHGDLWSGNAAFDERGHPVLFDPAAYYGDREADLAMTELFGGFPGDFYAAYREVFALDAGYAVRKCLYNLYHVLNHLNLFGAAYLRQAERMVERLLTEV